MTASWTYGKSWINGEILTHTDLNGNFENVRSNCAVASGIATLDGSTLVVQNPANATATPTASKIPIADGSGDIADGWLTSNVPLKNAANAFTDNQTINKTTPAFYYKEGGVTKAYTVFDTNALLSYVDGYYIVKNLAGVTKFQVNTTTGAVYTPGGYTQPGTDGETLKIIRGSIFDNAVYAGTGFSFVHNGNGDYSITFSTAFSGVPSCTVSTWVASNANASFAVTATTGITVYTYNSASTKTDYGFHFICIGPV